MIQNISAGIPVNLIFSMLFGVTIFLVSYKSYDSFMNVSLFLILLLSAIVIFTQINFSKVELSEKGLTVKGTLWSAFIPQRSIRHVSIVSNLSTEELSWRTNGLSVFGYNVGKFKLANGGLAFVLTNQSPYYAVLTVDHPMYKKVIISIDESNIRQFTTLKGAVVSNLVNR